MEPDFWITGEQNLFFKKGKVPKLERKFPQNSVRDVFAGFPPPAPTWRFHTNLYKFGGKGSPHVLHNKNCCDLNLGEGLCIHVLTFVLLSGSGLYLLSGFNIYFDLFWMAWHWKPAISQKYIISHPTVKTLKNLPQSVNPTHTLLRDC